MDAGHLKYLIGEKAFRAATINFFINGAITYFVFNGIKTIPVWGGKSIGRDIIVTVFLVTLFVSMIATTLTLKKVRRGHLQKSSWRRSSHPLLGKLPQKTFARSIVLAVAVVISLVPAITLILGAMNITEMPFGTYIIFKSSFTALLAAFVSPFAALCALGDA